MGAFICRISSGVILWFYVITYSHEGDFEYRVDIEATDIFKHIKWNMHNSLGYLTLEAFVLPLSNLCAR